MPEIFDYCILGAGLAGISLANELLIENASVCLIDPNGIAGGASGTPLGLINPATGRYATKSWQAEKCYSAITHNLQKVQESSPVLFFKESGVLRPALESKIAERMKENVLTQNWPEHWIQWMDQQELKSFHPEINCEGGGVWLPIGLSVDVGTYLKEFEKYLVELGLKNFFNLSYSFVNRDNFWEIEFKNHQHVKANNLIFCTGSYSLEFKHWGKLPLYPVKGQLAVLESNSPLSFSHSVSALGYITSLDNKRFVIGSTYEHSFDYEGIDQQGLEYLLGRFNKVLPELFENSKVIHQWAGIRASTPNRMPILGKHPGLANCFIFAGLGSKGLLYSGYISKLMKDYLINSSELPPELDIKRLKLLV